MNERTLKDLYFTWLCNKVGQYRMHSWLKALHETDYIFHVSMDKNREADGVALRYRFGEDAGIEQPVITAVLDKSEWCSLLEMIVALCLRISENLLSGSENDTNYIFRVIDRHIEQYTPHELAEGLADGSITLFPLYNRNNDTELWYQAHQFLKEHNM